MADFIISMSYGNYLIQNGGTDKVIREHQELFAAVQTDYIFIFPVIRRVKIGKIVKTFRYWGVDKNKKFEGIYNLNGVLGYIGEHIKKQNRCIGLFIHHTWRIQPEDLIKVLNFIDVPVYYYLHDFYPLCEGKNLISNLGEYCGYGLDSFECFADCQYYAQTVENRSNMKRLMKEFDGRITFIAPSENTRNIYCNTFCGYEDKFISLAHQREEGTYKRAKADKPLKIAFIGKQAHLKGWDDYKKILCELEDIKDYEFFYLGTGEEQPQNIKTCKVSVREQGADAMVNALRELQIDVVMLLSGWPETYSYTYFEAYAAGCYIITYRCSGNMTDMVNMIGNGMVAADINELMGIMKNSGDFVERVKQYFARDYHIPDKLSGNDEIVKIVMKNFEDRKEFKSFAENGKKCILADMFYRLQNGRKLREI